MSVVANSTSPMKIKRSVCVKYLKFLYYLKNCNLEKQWNRYYCCVFKTALDENITIKRLAERKYLNKIKLIKNKEIRYNKLLSYLVSKPIKLSSFDFNDTLVNTKNGKHSNNILFDKNIFKSLFNLLNTRNYQIVIFSNQTNVSSCVHDYDNLKYNKLPNFFSKIRDFKKSLAYFNSLFISENQKKCKQIKSHDIIQTNLFPFSSASPLLWDNNKSQENYQNFPPSNETSIFMHILKAQSKHNDCYTYLVRKYFDRFFSSSHVHNYKEKKKKIYIFPKNNRHVLTETCINNSNLRRQKKNKIRNYKSCIRSKIVLNCNSLNYFFSLGKCEISEIDMYSKPEIGQYCLYMCIEGIKYLIILKYYFNDFYKFIENNMNMITNEDLKDFIKLSIDIFNSEEICILTKNIKKRNYLNINKLTLKILDTYINTIIHKNEKYILLKEKHKDDIQFIEFFLCDQIYIPSTNMDEKILFNKLNNNDFLKHLLFWLVYKNKIIRKLTNHFSSLLLNFRHSFYVGNNVGRSFDISDVDLKFSQNIGIKSYADTWFQQFNE
ncbi:phosphatase, putative [Plasmodium chabaudi adami]|uniref:Phosphatase, putative n=1 Tax=Plasmodium chabaudi adami TaxID=5826 RepID=A0A1C6XM93_PLACE|nr:phosphatase, putative [Plasmodium chabaudi adami]